MSTVLTNGIIIPENGSRNWGGDLANNWNILDVHVGYMNDVKNRVTTLENSVAENTANIQINASNISALQTSKQDTIEDLENIRSGANAGATAVQQSELNNYVDLSSEQTIAGSKTFSDDLRISKTINGVTPGALSLPKYDQYVTLAFQLNAQIQAIFSGFLQVKANVSSGAYLIVKINDLEVTSISPYANTGCVFVPVTANDQIYVTVTGGEYLGYGSLIIFKAQGNV